MNPFEHLHQGTLSGERPVGEEINRKQDPKGVNIEVEAVVGKIHSAYLVLLPETITDIENIRVQNKVYEIIKDEVSQAMIRIRKELKLDSRY